MDRININEFLQSVTGEEINICYYLVNRIKELPFDEQVQIVSLFCELYGTIDSKKTFCVDNAISEQKYNELKKQYGQYVNDLLKALLCKAYSCEWDENNFYSSLWKSLTGGGMLDTIEELAFGLYYVVIDRRIPYNKLKLGTKMDQDVYKAIIEENQETIKKIHYILSFPFEQKTEEASLILDEIEKYDEKDKRIVLLSVALNHIRKDRDRAFDMVKDLLQSQ